MGALSHDMTPCFITNRAIRLFHLVVHNEAKRCGCGYLRSLGLKSVRFQKSNRSSLVGSSNPSNKMLLEPSILIKTLG